MPNVPPLRFPEFTEEWEKCIFADICKITTGNKNTQDKEDNGIYPFYVRSQQIERINSYTFDGEAVLTAGDGVGVGKVFHYSKGKIGVHQRVYILCNFIGVGKYIYYYFTKNFYNRVKRMSAKNSVDSVRYDMIAQMSIYMPSVPEQDKIASLLTTVDQRISTQIRVIDKLESLIKGIYQKVFDSSNANYLPLAQLSTIQKGEQVNSEGFTETGDYYVMNGGITPSGYYNRYNSVADTISISEGGNSCGYVQYNTECFWSGGHYYTLLDIDSSISKLYLYHYLKYKEKDIMALRIGSGLPNIQKKDLSKFPILVLPLSEQQRVVNLLQLIAEKIKVEKDNLSHLSQQKAYLLQNMFI